MAFADPQTVTINAVAKVLPRVSVDANGSKYSLDTGDVKMSVAHSYGKRTRRTYRIDLRKVAPDPLISAQNIYYNMSFYIVVDVPVTGFTIAEQKQLTDGFITYLQATSGAQMTKFLGGES
jgi:hypothetical protein